MLGYDIQISTDENQEKIIFHYEDLWFDWAYDLVKENKAKQLTFNGYPNKFEIKVSVALERLESEPERKKQTVLTDTKLLDSDFKEKDNLINLLLKLDPEQILYIEAWDLS